MNCPWCDASFDLVVGIGAHRPPQQGDVAMCVQCGTAIVIGMGLDGATTLTRASEEQRRIVRQDPLAAFLESFAMLQRVEETIEGQERKARNALNN